MEAKFSIGQQYLTRGKHPRLCTIIDILKTYNARNECVKLRYVATHEFLGQTLTNSDVCETTVAMGLWELANAAKPTRRAVRARR